MEKLSAQQLEAMKEVAATKAKHLTGADDDQQKNIAPFADEQPADNEPAGDEQSADDESQDQAVDSLEALFGEESDDTVVGGANQLKATAALTSVSTDIMRNIWQQMSANKTDYTPTQIKTIFENHNLMDALIKNHVELSEGDYSFLPVDNKEEIEKMIRSQQSKRSRAKSKVLNIENFQTAMVGAIAENILRLASGQEKNAGRGGSTTELTLSEQEIEELTADKEKLNKAIRNVQSKKSIMKAKSEFSDEAKRKANPTWIALEEREAQLKKLRDTGTLALSEEDQKKLEAAKATEAFINSIDIDSIKSPEDAKSLLENMKNMLASME